MKTLFLILSILGCTNAIFAQLPIEDEDHSAEFKKQVKSFTKSAQGLYEVRNTDERIPESQRQPQDLLMFPITHWNTEKDAWFCFVWLSPKFKEKPLELVLIHTSYNDAQMMRADFYSMPATAPEGFLLEWRKAKPFAPMTADFLMTEAQPCKGFISIGEDGVYKMQSFEPCPRNTKGAGYVAISVDSRFYGKTYSSGVKFHTPDGKILLEHSHEFKSKKTSSSLKKY